MGDFIDRTYLISEKYLDQIKSASFTFMISDSGMTYDFSDDNAKKEVLKHYEDISDYNEENLADNTIYKIGESGWEVEDSEGFELEEVQSGNTYNHSYLGIMDINYRIYEDKVNGKFIGFIKPHLQGDIRGGYGTGFILIGDDKEEMFYAIYDNYISGFGSVQIEFNDGATLLFDSQQDSDTWSFELLDENSSYENSSIAKDYINDWEESTYGSSFLEETVEMANSEPRNSVYALGGSVEDNEPRAYIVSLSDYNDGKSIGKWIDISTFADGDDVMAEINNFLEELNKKDDGNREEYAVHDYEGIGKSFYSESMGEEDFDEIINAYSDLENADYPIEVIEEYRDEKMGDSHDFSDVLRQMEQEDRGNYSDREDFAYQLVEEGTFIPSIHNLDVSETDIRLIAGEESDNAVYDLDNNYEDAIDQAQMSSDYEFEKTPIEERIEELENEISTLEEQLEDVEGEDYDVSSEQLSDAESSLVDEEGALQDLEEEWGKKAIESIRDEVYDDIEDKLNNNLGDYLDELGYGEEPHKANFVIVDYESIADDLEQDHDFFESNDGTLYVFSNYKEGGTVIEKVSYDYFIVDKLKDPRIVKGYKTKAEAQSDASKHKGKKLKVINRNSAKKKGLPVDDISMFSSSVLDLDGKPNLGIKAKGGKIKRVAKGIGKGASRLGRGIQDQWREADFGDGKGKAEFFAEGGSIMSREEIVGKYKEGTLFDDKGNLVIDKEKMYQMIYLNDLRQNPNKYAYDEGGSAKYPRGYYPKIEFWSEKMREGAEDELIDNVTEAQESASHFIEQQDKLENPQKYQPKEKTPQEERKMSAWYKFVKKHKGSGKTLKQIGTEFKKTNKYVDGGETIDPHHLYCNYCVRKAMDTGKLDIEEDDYNEFIWENDSLSNEDRQKLENKLKDYATYPQAVQDVMGIHAFTGCENCIDEQKAGFKPHTFTDPKAYRQNMEDYGERLDSDYEDGGEIRQGDAVRYNGDYYFVHSIDSSGKFNLNNPYKGYMMEYLVDPKKVELDYHNDKKETSEEITTGTAYYITNDSAGNDYDSLEQNVLESKKEFNNLIDEGKILEFYFNIKVKYDWQIVQAIYQQMADDNLSQDNNHIIGYSISLSVSGFSPSMPYNVDEDDEDDDYEGGGEIPEEGTSVYLTKEDSEVEVYNEETQELIMGGFETFNEADDWANRNNLEISWRQDEEDEGYDDGGSVKKKVQIEEIDYDSLEYGKGGAVKSKKIITQKLGLTDEIADQLIGMSEKFAVWIANQQLDSLGRSYDLQNFGKKDEHWEWKDIPKEHRNSRKTTAEQLSNIKAVSLFSSSDPKVYRSQDYRQVLDWLQYPTTPKQNLRELTMEQALVEAEEWHEALTTTGGDINYVEPEENVILHSYPVDEQGVEYYWIQMPTNFCDIESSRMGHCGRTGYDNNLISLRSKRQHLEGNTISDSHVTIAYSPNDGKFYQVKGKKNQKPAEKYHEKIFDLIMIMAEDDSWKRNNERLEQEGIESGRREEKLRKEAKEINKKSKVN